MVVRRAGFNLDGGKESRLSLDGGGAEGKDNQRDNGIVRKAGRWSDMARHCSGSGSIQFGFGFSDSSGSESGPRRLNIFFE